MSSRLLSIVVIAATVSFSCGKKDAETTGTAPAAANHAPPPLPAGISQNLKKNAGEPVYIFDNLGSVKYPAIQKSIQIAGDTAITTSGWTLDESKESPAGGVDVVIDQTPYSARYGLERTDVASHFKRPDYTNSGFLLTMAPGQLNKGPHSISVRVISSDKKSYNEGPVIQFTVN